MNQPKPKGGKREGSGRKPAFVDKDKITFNLEKADKEILKQKYPKILNKMFLDWVRELIKE